MYEILNKIIYFTKISKNKYNKNYRFKINGFIVLIIFYWYCLILKTLKKDIFFLSNPKLKPSSLDYILNQNSLYINLFELSFKRNIIIYIYSFTVFPKIEDGDIKIREYLYGSIQKQLKSLYGECFISGNNIYSLKKVDTINYIKAVLYYKVRTFYDIVINKYVNKRNIDQNLIYNDPLIIPIISYFIL